MLDINFEPFPILETERLTIHDLTLENAGDMFLLRSNPVAMRYIGKPLLQSLAEAEELIEAYRFKVRKNAAITWGITLKSENQGLVGTIGYHKIEKENYRAEIGYILHPDQWNKGLMDEAIAKVLDYGFQEMRLHSVEAKVAPENHSSSKVLLKHGFIKEAHLKENFFSNGEFLDTEIYSLIR